MQDYVGKQIDRYRIIERLGMGGMAVVYKAYDTRLERDVALKLIRTEAIPPEQYERLMKRFEREAKAQARFNHRHIVPVYDYGEVDGAPYLVMAYIPGGTLKARTRQRVPYQQALRWLIPVADALVYAHDLGVIHRDIKPSNILFDVNDQPVLTDFGIAKILETDEATLTGTGLGVGTPEYMAPEQWQGQSGPATDQYALGVVLYELLTGQKPYTADTPAAIILLQATEPLRSPRELAANIPEGVERLLYKTLARRPEDRYEDMAELKRALETRLASQTPKPVEAVIATPSTQTIDAQGSYSEGETVDLFEATPVEKDKTIEKRKKDELKEKRTIKYKKTISAFYKLTRIKEYGYFIIISTLLGAYAGKTLTEIWNITGYDLWIRKYWFLNFWLGLSKHIRPLTVEWFMNPWFPYFWWRILLANLLTISFINLLIGIKEAEAGSLSSQNPQKNPTLSGLISLKTARLVAIIIGISSAGLFSMLGLRPFIFGTSFLLLNFLFSFKATRLKSIPFVNRLTRGALLGGLPFLASYFTFFFGTSCFFATSWMRILLNFMGPYQYLLFPYFHWPLVWLITVGVLFKHQSKAGLDGRESISLEKQSIGEPGGKVSNLIEIVLIFVAATGFVSLFLTNLLDLTQGVITIIIFIILLVLRLIKEQREKPRSSLLSILLYGLERALALGLLGRFIYFTIRGLLKFY